VLTKRHKVVADSLVEMEPPRDDVERHESGIRVARHATQTYRLVAQWAELQPVAAHRPADVHALAAAIAGALRACMEAAAVNVDAGGVFDRELDDSLDATYVLERLQWCVAHGVPYIVRPRVPQVG
jgi:hypothetical protein